MNRIDIVDHLLQAGAKINGSYRGGNRPLTDAVYNGFPEMTQFLLDHGANPFYTDNDGDTLINIVCLTPMTWDDSDYELTLIILLNYRDPKGNKLDVDTPLGVVAHYKNLNLVSILLDYGADPNLINWDELSIDTETCEFIQNYLVNDIKEPEFT